MSKTWRAVVAAVAGIAEKETRVERRGFRVTERAAVIRLECIGAHFVHGYNSALRSASMQVLERELQGAPSADLGFRYEGAGMGLAVRDWFTPRSKLFHEFITGPARPHEYMAWVGRGWLFA